MLSVSRPPVFEDREKTHQALLVFAFGWMDLGFAVYFLALAPSLPGRYFTGGILVLAVGCATLILTSAGRITAAAILNVGVLWLAFTALATTAGGLGAPETGGYVALVVVAGLLLGWTAGAVVAAASLLASLALALAAIHGLLPHSEVVYTPLTWWVSFVPAIISVFIIQTLASRTLKAALQDTEHELAERRRTETTLRASEQRFRELATLLPVGIYECDTTGRITYANQRALSYFGYSSEELESLTVLDVVAPDDRERAEDVLGFILKGGRLEGSEYMAARKDGSQLPIAVYSSPILSQDRITGARGVVVSIEERRQAEEALRESESRFKTIVDLAPDAFFIADATGRFIEANDAACNQLGWTREELLQKSVLDIVAPWVVDDAKRRLSEMKSEYGFFESTHVRRDGSLVPVELSIRCVTYRGQPAMVAVSRDISERKRAEEEKRAFYRETILSATDGKLDIVAREEFQDYFATAEAMAPARTPAEAQAARRDVEGLFRSKGLDGDSLAMFVVAAGEAIANSLKHAGEGRVYAGSNQGGVWAMVTDNGPGIEALTLPKAALRMRYSTKRSMGLGYSIMLGACDRIRLATGPEGTTVVLIKSIEAPAPPVELEDFPDTWDEVAAE